MEQAQWMIPEETLDPPEAESFKFPFNPYPIQIDFMKALFTALEGRKLGIFESPTGTGKSLSMLCGSLTWLGKRDEAHQEHLERVVNSIDIEREETNAKGAIDWIQAQHQLRQKREVVNAARRELKYLQNLSDKRKKYLSRKSTLTLKTDKSLWKKNDKNLSGKQDNQKGDKESMEDDLDALILNDDFAPELCSDSDVSDGENDVEQEFYPNRIIFASRTHSQLSQFANELKRTEFASKVTTCSLGSRQNLCINPDVTKLKNLSLINERCLEIQKGSKGKKTSETKKMKGCGGCPYFNHILSEPMDIEDLVNTAKQLNACPYYASRKASKEAQLVMLPYNTILHKSTREGVGLKIKNSTLLLDEAHNIIESISNMYSTSITLGQLENCATGLKTYMQRYMNRFNSKHLLKLKQISFIIKALQKFIGGYDSNNKSQQNVFTIQEFKVEAGIDNLDIYELQTFIRKSKLIFKLKGYLIQKQKIEEKSAELKLKASEKQTPSETASRLKSKPNSKTTKTEKTQLDSKTQKAATENANPTLASPRPQSGQSIIGFAEFLKSLLTLDSGGRIIREGDVLKFLLLSTSDHFLDLLNSSRSIILAGGTMKPYDEVEDQLFQPAKERIFHFSCDHVIPDENLVCIALNRGPTSKLFDFTYQSRKTSDMMEELARTIVNVSKIVPGGLVCFLPSYDYETTLQTYLKKSGYLEKIEVKKKVFREPKGSNCDTILTEYSRQIKNSGGAVLFAVVGGKLSEGINFSDDLGRCVLVVGLPYPNVTSVEIKEKVQFASENFGKDKGSQLLANMCSKAVNQSIGRAIRHSQDYAAIILIDHRFSRPNQQALLPNWILKRFQVSDQFGHAIGSIAKFFASKKA
ncbi:putative ATP-dependent RNA helicase DDX11-like protein 8 [Orchesella cincta]|uniref:Putative ATP-dependent RNA helicase DDX11-like protein 8 n=1 Tax=Orchesella cincta TaxID=48709 RepID=A0A1D2MKG0_ORCCI|nr:putative ATP-dependent RNA helicase DDX11-like protein 8 [Orchesella cincta]